jgi:hypothetical protein
MHSAENVLERTAVANMHTPEGEVAPTAHRNMKAAIVFIGDDLTCVIAKNEPVTLKKQGCNWFDLARLIKIERPHAPVRRLEK